MKKTNNNAKFNNKVKPIFKTFPFVASGMDQNGKEYNPESCKDIMVTLESVNTFGLLSINAMLAKSYVQENAKGVTAAARIQSYNTETGELELAFFGKNVELVPIVDNMVVIPHVRTGKNTTDIVTITGFELVPAMMG